jgi:hypothetical protein
VIDYPIVLFEAPVNPACVQIRHQRDWVQFKRTARLGHICQVMNHARLNFEKQSGSFPARSSFRPDAQSTRVKASAENNYLRFWISLQRFAR